MMADSFTPTAVTTGRPLTDPDGSTIAELTSLRGRVLSSVLGPSPAGCLTNARTCRAADHTLRLLGCDLIYGAGRDAACRGASDFASGLAGRPPRSGSTWVSCNTELQH